MDIKLLERSLVLATVIWGSSAQVFANPGEPLASPKFVEGYPTPQTIATLRDELYFQQAVQSYLWAIPALNMQAMKEGSEAKLGAGYNVLPIWKDRLSAKTLVTTPNSDVIYAMGYLDLGKDGPLVVEVPPGLQGRTANAMGRIIASEFTGEAPGGKWYKDRQYINGFPAMLSPEFQSPAGAPTYNNTFLRTGFFTDAYSASPAMAINMVGIGAKYLISFKDSAGAFLSGGNSYVVHLPPHVPAKIFWSFTLYDASNASGLDNGQPFPSLDSMDKPLTNADKSTDLYIGPKLPGAEKNYLATVPGKGFFVILRLYGPTQEFFDQSWKPGDVERR